MSRTCKVCGAEPQQKCGTWLNDPHPHISGRDRYWKDFKNLHDER